MSAVLVSVCSVYIAVKNRNAALNVSLDDIVGEKCTVIETVDNYAGSGQVRVKGTEWSARSVDDDDVFEAGTTLRVVAIEGVKLICNKN
ncbi:MAG: NfeD family protein [Clostridia bacterium]|nr:NfeD family protein [Clostridia bacterium]